ncbi:hypothetical protein A9Q84_05340 [Halobacteriovorax marinus]|uniref:BF1531-like N-terminal domain-containing protein n=1 Tax=Halobacteriovorax marinus TaxID=97084 RepID=A0A1Y5FBG7_9BACT|nr:hypothetical protein A9Q84_05340 [Halobacteriovorax marinus]
MKVNSILEFPFNNQDIFLKKKKIKRFLLSEGKQLQKKKIAILGGVTTSEVINILDLYLLYNGVSATFYESEYNKYFEDSIFGNSDLDSFSPDLIFICTHEKNIQFYPESGATQNLEELIEQELGKYISMWDALQAKFNCPVVQNNFELPMHREMGNLDRTHSQGRSNFVSKINQSFVEEISKRKNIFIHDINYLSSWLGLTHWHNPSLWFSSKYAISFEVIPSFANNLSRLILSIWGKSKKLLILDLDNTLWGGVVGDDGVEGIKLGDDSGVGEAYILFQKCIKNLSKQGVALAICSKNEHSNAIAGLGHPDSILNESDFAVIKANWEPKHLNIRSIIEEVNLGQDSVVFFDDNPAERDLVKSQLPLVEVPDIGSNIEDYIYHLTQNSYFESVNLSNDDFKRVKYYSDNKKRSENKELFADYSEFLESLQMEAEIAHASPVYLERITQLINKTNQFNLTTRRYDFSKIEKFSNSSEHLLLYGRLKDKFGDNGLVTVVSGVVRNQALVIDLWLMSCRVLKRDLELAMFDKLIEECNSRGIQKIVGEYIESKKNMMVSDFYERLGFSPHVTDSSAESESIFWEFSVKNTGDLKNKFIKLMK